MRTNKFAACFAVAFSFVLAATTSSYGLLADTQYFDFSGWTHATVVSPAGQDFNLGGGLTANVKAVGDFSFDSAFVAGAIRDGQLNANELNSYTVTFNQALQLVVKTATVDTDEIVTIVGGNPASYVHSFGAAPTITPLAGGLQIQGNGFGISPTGAALGETRLGTTSTVTFTHASLFFQKYEFFMVGQIVPEPGSLGLLAVGLLGLLRFRKK